MIFFPFSKVCIRLLLTVVATFTLANIAMGAAPHESNLKSFQGGPSDGALPVGGIVADSSGNFYGTTSAGGEKEWGTVFELTPQSDGTWNETVLYNFQGSGFNLSDGATPTGSLIFDTAGNLYGTTSSGGFGGNDCNAGGGGTVFELSPSSDGGPWTETVLHTFKCATGNDGANPYGALVIDAQGNLYGTTQLGGTANVGTVYELSSSGGSWNETTIYNFQGGIDGYSPEAGLVLDSKGVLYGTTINGGSSGRGTVFRLSHQPGNGGSWIEQILYSFAGGSDGANPYSAVILKKNVLYGTTLQQGQYGYGTVFQLTVSGGVPVETVLYGFQGDTDGANPYGGLISDPAGNLYGTTEFGGAGKFKIAGTLYQLKPGKQGSPWTETILHNFEAEKDGGFPTANLIIFEDALWSTTSTGGFGGTCRVDGCGVVFRFGY